MISWGSGSNIFLHYTVTSGTSGICHLQVEALRAGLNDILPVQCLTAFQPSELQQRFCGHCANSAMESESKIDPGNEQVETGCAFSMF